MSVPRIPSALLAFGVCLALTHRLAAIEPAVDALPPAATGEVDFRRDVQPLLEASCIKCHGRGKSKGGWKLDTRADFLAEADSGPAVVPGNSAESHLVHLVAGTDPDNVMPEKGTRLTPDQVGILRAWIDADLPWPDDVTFAQLPPNNLHPRQPDLPDGPADHPVDRLMAPYFRSHGIRPAGPVDDRTFLRRVSLDVIGLLPTPDEQEAFLRDRGPDRRERLVDRLLADGPRYAQHWLTFWNDLLRNDYKGTGYIDGGRSQISRWLYGALLENRPYDRFVGELVNPVEGSEGFTKGIVWRGAVNASMTPPMQAAQNIGQVLMGVNLKCASCHDSFIDDWQLADAYGLAGIYAEGPLEMVQCDKPTGRIAPLKFLFPELGSVDADAPRAERLGQLAALITRRENGRLSRTVVNRLWARLTGRGLVEPLDVMQNEAWHPDLLDWLAEDLAGNGWDLKRTLRLILTSAAYRMPAVDLPEPPQEDFVFTGPAIRRLTAEQFRDALGLVTGVWHDRPEGGLDRLLQEPDPDAAPTAGAFWIWSDPHAAAAAPPGTNGFLRELVLADVPDEATMFVHADNTARVFVNGRRLRGADAPDWSQPGIYDARPALRAGTNHIAVEVVNGGDSPNPAGLLAYARLRHQDPAGQRVLDIGSDATWQAIADPTAGWQERGASAALSPAHVLGGPGMAPWSVGDTLAAHVAGRTVYGNVRSSLVAADPLALALGRPNREQVTTVRQSTATTIQALELTNGSTLAAVLAQGAERLIADHPDGRDLVDHVFRQALTRKPTWRERGMSRRLVGRQPSREGVEDLLWAVAMLPEFQLTY